MSSSIGDGALMRPRQGDEFSMRLSTWLLMQQADFLECRKADSGQHEKGGWRSAAILGNRIFVACGAVSRYRRRNFP
jgi:hypothetical protein